VTETVGTDVLVTFKKPEDNGDPITGYQVEFLAFNEEFREATECTSSLVSISATEMQCVVSFTELRNAQFSLQFD